MRPSLHYVLSTLLIVIGALALGGCDDDEDDEVDVGALVLDDDRATSASAMNVHIALASGAGTPRIVTIAVGETLVVTLPIGTYVVTYDDGTTGGVGQPHLNDTDDTIEMSVQIITDGTTTIEYVTKGDSDVIGPVPRANG